MSGPAGRPYESTGPRSLTRTTAAERRQWAHRAAGLSMIELLQAVHCWRARAMRVRSAAGALWLELRDRDGTWHRVGPEQRRHAEIPCDQCGAPATRTLQDHTGAGVECCDEHGP